MRRSARSPLGLAGPAIAMALLLGGCGTGPTRTISDGRFVLELTASRLDYRVGDAVDVRATLRYAGREPSITVLPDDVGLVAFTFRQLDGPGLMRPISNLMCSGQDERLGVGNVRSCIRGTLTPAQSTA